MAESNNKIQCGNTVVDLENLHWNDSNNNNVPDEGEVSVGKDKYLSADELKCYRETVGNKLKPYRNYRVNFPEFFKEDIQESLCKVIDCYAPRFRDGTLAVSISSAMYTANLVPEYMGPNLYRLIKKPPRHEIDIHISGVESTSDDCPHPQSKVITLEKQYIDEEAPYFFLEALPFLESAFKEALGIKG